MKANSKDMTAFTLVSSISIVTMLQTGKGDIDSKSCSIHMGSVLGEGAEKIKVKKN